jgi:hypothetical protein
VKRSGGWPIISSLVQANISRARELQSSRSPSFMTNMVWLAVSKSAL